MSDPMRSGDPTRDEARWCETHRRWECARRTKRGSTCHGSSITGLDRCRMHAGERSEVARAKGEAITAWSAAYGQRVVTARQAVMGMLQMSWLRVHLYAGLLREQVETAQTGRKGTEDGDGDGEVGPGVGPGVGLIGHTYGAVKDVGIYATGEAVRGLAQLESAERERCVKFAKTAHDMRIDEEEIQLAKQQGELLAGVINRILDALELSAKQRARVPDVVPRELRAIAGGED